MAIYAADKFTIKITQGNDWEYPLTISTIFEGVKTPVDLTNAAIVGVVRPTYTQGTAVLMNVIINDLLAGQVTLTLTDQQTMVLPPGNLVYEITITIAGNTKTYLSGTFQVKPKVQYE